MAGRIQGITVEIGGDTTKLQTALKGVNTEIRNTQSQLRDVDKLLKLDPGNTELLAQKHRLLGDAVKETKEKLETLKTAAEQAEQALKDGTITQEQYDGLQREIAETEQKLKALEEQARQSGTALQEIAAKGEKLKTVGDNVTNVGKKFMPVTLGVVGLGTAAVKTAADFDSAMSKVAAVSGATGSDLEALRDADDGVVHCRTKEEALYIKEKLAKRFEECKLELHPVKTRIVYCKDKDRTKEEELTEFDFLGYTFKAVYIKCKDGVMRNSFIASVSKTAAKGFRDKIKALEIHKRTGCKIDMIAELLNPMIRGWMNYFGKFNPSAMKNTLQCIERRLIKWAMCKYKSFRGRRRRAEKWLSSIRKREPKLFAHWSRMYSYC